MGKCIISTAASSSTAVSVPRRGSEPPDLYTDTAGEAWFCLAATVSRSRSYTCTHVTAAQHVLYLTRGRAPAILPPLCACAQG